MQRNRFGIARRIAPLLAAIAVVITSGRAGSDGQNLLENPDFGMASMIQGWENGAPGATQIDWDSRDRSDASDSGSLRVTNMFANGSEFGGNGAEQCVSVSEGVSYPFGGWIFVPSGQPTTGNANLNLFWYDMDDCEGSASFASSTNFVTDTDEWQQREGDTGPAPAGTRSVSVTLWTSKIEDGGSRVVLFDDVYFMPEPPGLALAVTGLSTLGVLRVRRSREPQS